MIKQVIGAIIFPIVIILTTLSFVLEWLMCTIYMAFTGLGIGVFDKSNPHSYSFELMDKMYYNLLGK